MRIVIIPRESFPSKVIIKNAFIAPHTGIQVPGSVNRTPLKTNPCIILTSANKQSCTYAMVYRVIALKNDIKPTTPRTKSGVSIWDWDNILDTIGCCKIQIMKNGNIKVSNDRIFNEFHGCTDSRIFRWNDGYYLQYADYQRSKRVSSDEIGRINIVKKGQMVIEQKMLNINLTDNYSVISTGKKPIAICRSQRGPYEKNWALVPLKSKTKMVFQNHFVGYVQFLKFLPRAPLDISCKSMKYGAVEKGVGAGSQTFFNRILAWNRHLLKEKEDDPIACTTPFAEWDSSSYVAMGHIKIDYKSGKVQAKLDKKDKTGRRAGDRLEVFMEEFRKWLKIPENVSRNQWDTKSLDMHPQYIYLSFFYVMKIIVLENGATTYRITRMSDFFLPKIENLSYKPTILFPMGFERTLENGYVVSFGASDIDIGLMIITREELRSRLKHKIWDNPEIRARDVDFKLE